MALTLRTAFRIIGKVAKIVPGVGTTLGEALEIVVGKEDRQPTADEMSRAVDLVEKVKSANPGVWSSEFALLAVGESIFGKILYDPAAPNSLRIAAMVCMAALIGFYAVSRGLVKGKSVPVE